jgi:hypothetical protein
MIDDLIKQLSTELELEEPLAPQMPGIFSLPLEESVHITIADKPPGFRLTCNVAPLPKKEEEEVLTRLMLGNLFGQGTKGAVLGLNEEGNLLTLSQDVDYNADYKEFRDIIEDFINTVDYWRIEMQNAA